MNYCAEFESHWQLGFETDQVRFGQFCDENHSNLELKLDIPHSMNLAGLKRSRQDPIQEMGSKSVDSVAGWMTQYLECCRIDAEVFGYLPEVVWLEGLAKNLQVCQSNRHCPPWFEEESKLVIEIGQGCPDGRHKWE